MKTAAASPYIVAPQCLFLRSGQHRINAPSLGTVQRPGL